MTIFLFILVNNWIGILPGFGTIGWVESPEKVVHHAEVKAEKDHGHVNLDTVHLQVFEGTGPIVLLPPGSINNHMTVSEGYVLEEDGHLRELDTENRHGFNEGQTPGLLIPYLRSANSDLNTPLALALVAMVMIHWWAFSTLGVFGHLGKFINFKQGPIMFVVGILEIIGELARIVSFTFRLFGNMLAGEIVLFMMTFLLVFLAPLAFYGLEILVGGVQALIFMGLTLVFTVMAVAPHEGHEEEHSETASK